MTSEYDFSVYEVKEHNFSFANLSAEEAEEKKRLYEQFVAEKEELKKSADSGQSSVASPESEVVSPEVKKPVFKPSFKAKDLSPTSDVQRPASNESNVQSPESNVQSLTSKLASKP
jgi:NADH-quinone oxidoreductase subunit I